MPSSWPARASAAAALRLSDGHGVTFARAAHAQLEPTGLYFAAGRMLCFVPRSRIRFG